jgi:hypothetical protein
MGRFVSADPNIQAPGNLQSYNRYAYVLNNPLSLTDPSGYFSFGGFFRAVTGGLFVSSSATSKSISGQLGFVGGYYQTGTLEGGVRAAVGTAMTIATAGLTNGLTGWEAVFANGMVGGVTSYATGGDFKSGFIASSFNAFVDVNLGTFQNTYHQAMFKALTGGVAARLTGGNFKNGALSSGISAYITGSLGESRYNKQLSANEDFSWMGADSMVTAVRPLDHPLIHLLGDPMFLPTAGGWLDGSTLMLAHEQVFWTGSSGKLEGNLGYNPNGVVPEGLPNNDMPINSFRANPQRYTVPSPLKVMATMPAPFNNGSNYQLLKCNCQDFAKTMRNMAEPKN